MKAEVDRLRVFLSQNMDENNWTRLDQSFWLEYQWNYLTHQCDMV